MPPMFSEQKEVDFEKPQHITVCVCTYKRPALLMHLLQGLCRQRTNGLVNYSIVVVDNDSAESARHIVLNVKESSPLDIGYYCEPEQNISLTRNKTIEKSTGDLIVFIDDDQFPADDWLFNLYKAYSDFEADVVL